MIASAATFFLEMAPVRHSSSPSILSPLPTLVVRQAAQAPLGRIQNISRIPYFELSPPFPSPPLQRNQESICISGEDRQRYSVRGLFTTIHFSTLSVLLSRFMWTTMIRLPVVVSIRSRASALLQGATFPRRASASSSIMYGCGCSLSALTVPLCLFVLSPVSTCFHRAGNLACIVELFASIKMGLMSPFYPQLRRELLVQRRWPALT